MDEAQALSTKTAIMAHGELLCLGSVQHLKVCDSKHYLLAIFCVTHILIYAQTECLFGWLHD